MQLFLHIGTPKTGTTAIQRLMAGNEGKLMEQGILYPSAGRPTGPGRNGHYLLAWGIRGMHGITGTKAWDEMSAEIARQGLSRAVVSAEAFAGMSDEEVHSVRRLTEQYDATVILYLRNPLLFLASSYRQGIKTGRHRISFDKFVSSSIARIDYPSLIQRWSSVGRLQVCVYDAVKSRLELDFLDRIGAAGIYQVSAAANKTPDDSTINALVFLNRLKLNHRLDRWLRKRIIDGKLNFLRRRMPGVIEEDSSRLVVMDAVGRWDKTMMLKYVPEPQLDLLICDLVETAS